MNVRTGSFAMRASALICFLALPSQANTGLHVVVEPATSLTSPPERASPLDKVPGFTIDPESWSGGPPILVARAKSGISLPECKAGLRKLVGQQAIQVLVSDRKSVV